MRVTAERAPGGRAETRVCLAPGSLSPWRHWPPPQASVSFSVKPRASEPAASQGLSVSAGGGPHTPRLGQVRARAAKEGLLPGRAGGTALAAAPSAVRGDLLTSWSSSFQTREQLQADLLRCQAKIEDLEKLLVEKGQVSGPGPVLWESLRFCALGGVPGLGAGGRAPRSCAICPGRIGTGPGRPRARASLPRRSRFAEVSKLRAG